MTTPSFSTSFHKIMEGAKKPQIVYETIPFKLRTKHVIIGGVVILAVFGIGYYIGKQQMIKFSVRKYDPIYSEEVDKE